MIEKDHTSNSTYPVKRFMDEFLSKCKRFVDNYYFIGRHGSEQLKPQGILEGRTAHSCQNTCMLRKLMI